MLFGRVLQPRRRGIFPPNACFPQKETAPPRAKKSADERYCFCVKYPYHFLITAVCGRKPMQTMEEIKQLISANMEMAGADLAQFGADTPIFGEQGFGLDSLEAVELFMLLQKKYGITIENMQQGRAVFKDLGTQNRR